MTRVYQRRILEQLNRQWRAKYGEVDVAPHRPDDCPRWPRETPNGIVSDESPCPYASCKNHLFGDVTPDGSLRIYRPALEIDQLPDTCSIDVAMRGTNGFDKIGWYLGITARQARDDFESALRKIAPAYQRSLEREERERPGCTDSLELSRRSGGLLQTGEVPHFDPRSDDPAALDRTIPDGYVPLGETEVELMGQHREIQRLTEEHLMRQYRLPRLAERLYLMLIANAECRRCGLSDLTRVHAEQSGYDPGQTKIKAALVDLEVAGLIRIDWRACGQVRRLRGVLLVSSLKSVDYCPGGTETDDFDDPPPDISERLTGVGR